MKNYVGTYLLLEKLTKSTYLPRLGTCCSTYTNGNVAILTRTGRNTSFCIHFFCAFRYATASPLSSQPFAEADLHRAFVDKHRTRAILRRGARGPRRPCADRFDRHPASPSLFVVTPLACPALTSISTLHGHRNSRSRAYVTDSSPKLEPKSTPSMQIF